MEWISLLVSTGGVAIGSVCTWLVLNRVRRTDFRVVQLLRIEFTCWRIAHDLEVSIGEAYNQFEQETEGWSNSGRLNEAVLDARSRYEQKKRFLIENAVTRLDGLKAVAAKLSRPGFVDAMVEKMSESFPALGLLPQTRIEPG